MDGLSAYALPAGWAFAGRAIEHGGRILVGATSDTGAAQLLISEDGGATFGATPWTLTAGPPLRFASNGTRLVAGTATAFYYSDDAGDTWTLGRNSVNSNLGIVSDGVGFAAMALVVSTYSLWYSTDGSYWLSSTLPMNRPVKLVGAGGVMLLMGWHTTDTSKRIARSINHGASWTNVVNDTWSGFFQGITFDGSLGIAVGGNSRIFRTVDSGLTWADIGYPPVSTDLGAPLRNGATVLVPAIYPPTMLRSTDSGQTWTHFSAAGAAFTDGGLLDGVVRAGRMYLYNRDGYLALAQNLAYSDDNGSTWTNEAVSGVIDVLPASSGLVVITNSGAWCAPAGAPPEISASIDWGVTVVGAPQATVAMSWPVRVGAPAQVSLAWPVRVQDAALVGGLDGEAAWRAAPSGRWSALVTVAGTDISARLTGDIVVSRAADAAATAEFAFVPSAAIQPMGLIGQRVTIDFVGEGAGLQRMFTGVVDVPSIDLQTGTIACSCHDQAQEVWDNTPRETIDALVGGRWHVAVSGEPESSFDYLGERIASVGATWALDAWQQPRVLPWATPGRTVTVRTADVLEGSLAVEFPSRDQLRTRIDCRLQYRYTRLRQRGITAQWAESIGFFLPADSEASSKPPYTFMQVAMVESALGSVGGWQRQGDLQIVNPPAQTWTIGAGFYTISPRVAADLALSFSGKYTTRWQQSVTEDYTVSVVWPALEQQLGGPVREEMGATLEAAFDQPDWSSDLSVAPSIPNGGLTGDAVMPWQPEGADTAARDDVLRTLLDRAWVRLWGASRTGRVRFAVPCRPDLWLDVRATLEADTLRAAGAVVEVTHRLSTESGEAISDIALAVGMPGNTAAAHPAWSLPAAPVDTHQAPVALSFEIGTFVGGLFGSPPYDAETMIGFCTNAEGTTYPDRNYYPHSLSVRSPDIEAEARDPRTLEAVAELPVDVPTDLLEIL